MRGSFTSRAPFTSRTSSIMRERENIFIARQPIFDVSRRVFAYELLFRSGLRNVFDCPDGDVATANVIVNSFIMFDIQRLTDGRKAFVNLTQDILTRGYFELLPPDIFVAEILEDIPPVSDVLDACRALKEKGFLLALDDFIQTAGNEPYFDYADIVKVDFMQTSPEEQRALASDLLPRGVQLLAEKVETQEEFNRARDDGYTLFQGYFFEKPEVVTGKTVRGYKLNYMQMIREIYKEDLNLNDLEKVIKTDITLSFRLLKYINSAFFGLRVEIRSIKQALVLLGDKEIRKWASLVALSNMGADKPSELIRTALIRAHLCEELAPMIGLSRDAQDLFLMGLFSVIDAIMDVPIDQAIEHIPISKTIIDGLLGKPGKFRDLIHLVKSYESGRWFELSDVSASLGLAETELPGRYFDAIEWASECLSSQE